MLYYCFMDNVIKINNKNFSYKLLKTKGCSVKLSISRSGDFRVFKPWFVSRSMLDGFLFKKREWILDKFENFVKDDFIKYNLKDAQEYKKNKEKSLLFIRSRIEILNRVYDFEFNKISIRNQKTRWGSCSKNGNLSFNYKIIFLPIELADYIIVHELCHLKELNHSRDFWKLVAISCPDFKKNKRSLKNFSFSEIE